MKKLLVLLTVASLLLGLTSCVATPEDALVSAMEKTYALKSGQMTLDFSVQASAETYGISVTYDIESDLKFTTKNGVEIMQGEMSVNMFGQSIDANLYYDGTYVYTETSGVKVKQELSPDEASSEMGAGTAILLEKEDIVDPSVTVENNATVYSFGIDAQRFIELMGDNSTLSDFSDISNVELSITVANGYMTRLVAVFGASITEVDVEVTMDMGFINPGQAVEVTLPTDLDKYIENPFG